MSVEIYFVRDGSQPQRGAASYTKPLAACVEELGLKRDHWTSALDNSPRFGDQSVQASPVDEYKHVVCKIDDEEAKASGWKAGHYRIDMTPEEVIGRMGTPKASWE
jgi:hypothetical protein